MARPTRQGIDYFPYDIDLDQDDKLGMIIAEFKYKGELLFTKLCGWIYKTNGYYTEWNEDVQLRFLRRYDYCGFSVSFINEVVPRFIKWGLFDKTVFDAFQIITSSRIQSTWLDATRKRKERHIDERIWLLEVIDASEAEETPVSGGNNPQSKVKKSKLKKIGGSGAAKPRPPRPKKTLEEKKVEMEGRKKEFYQSLIPFVPQYGKEMIREFYDYWTEPNKSGTRFKKEMEDTWDVNRRLTTWEGNEQKFGKGKQKDNIPTPPQTPSLKTIQ
jgi:hypothetical protein